MKVNACDFSDEELVEMILKDSYSSQAVACLYMATKGPAIGIGIRNNVSEEVAQTLHTDAVMALVKNIENERFRRTSSLVTYLLGIFRMMLRNYFSRLGREPASLDDLKVEPEIKENVLSSLIIVEGHRALHQCLKTLSEDCQYIIEKRYFPKKAVPYEEIAEDLGLKNATVVRNKRGRCMKVLKECMAPYLNNEL